MTVVGAVLIAGWVAGGFEVPLPHRRPDVSEAVLTELVALALTAGHGFPAAVRTAAEAVGGAVGERATRALRRPTGDAPEVFEIARHAAATGAPIGESIARLADRQRADELESRKVAAQRLPVRLLLPLTLLILPGTVLLAMTPVVVRALEGLSF